MADKIKLRRDTQANWEAVNPILDEGELGVITDRNTAKIGDGTHGFNDLQGIHGVPEGWISVKDFGAKGDGITDDTEAIQKAFDSNFNNIFFPEGTYICNDVKIRKSLNIFGSGLLKNSYNPIILEKDEIENTNIEFSISSISGKVIETVEPHNISKDDYIRINTNEVAFTPSRGYKKTFLSKVIDTTTNTITIDENIDFLNLNVSTATVQKINLEDFISINISGIKFEGYNNTDNRLISLNQIINSNFYNINLNNSMSGLGISYGINININNCVVSNINTPGLGYGIHFGFCYNVNVFNIKGYNNRHTISTTGLDPTIHLNMFNNIIFGNIDSGINTHSAYFTNIFNNTISNSFKGISVYSPFSNIYNNRIENINSFGISCLEGASNIVIKNNIIKNTATTDFFSAIDIQLNEEIFLSLRDYIIIKNNSIINTRNGNSIEIYNNVSNYKYNYISITDNDLLDSGYTGIVLNFLNSIKTDFVFISNNRLKYTYRSSYHGIDLNNISNLFISNNVISEFSNYYLTQNITNINNNNNYPPIV